MLLLSLLLQLLLSLDLFLGLVIAWSRQFARNVLHLDLTIPHTLGASDLTFKLLLFSFLRSRLSSLNVSGGRIRKLNLILFNLWRLLLVIIEILGLNWLTLIDLLLRFLWLGRNLLDGNELTGRLRFLESLFSFRRPLWLLFNFLFLRLNE